MARETFVDTSGFYACVDNADDRHAEATAVLEHGRGRDRFLTTDYILDETITLLKMRDRGHLIERFLSISHASRVCRIEWMNPARFAQVRAFLLQHADHEYSFTDCFSFSVMREQGLQDALTKDGHFAEAGFRPLLL